MFYGNGVFMWIFFFASVHDWRIFTSGISFCENDRSVLEYRLIGGNGIGNLGDDRLENDRSQFSTSFSMTLATEIHQIFLTSL